jgi:hypothetical protein
LNFLLIAAVLLGLNRPSLPQSAREVFDKCKARVTEIDSSLDRMDVGFTQRMEMVSKGGEVDKLVFRITVRHGVFKRELISGTVPNGSRFDAGYAAFDKMFLLHEYFSDKGKTLSSCDLEDPSGSDDLRLNFSFAEPSDTNDPMSTVTASVNPHNYTPVWIREHLRGLPLGMEFDDTVEVSYDKLLNTYFPGKIVMHIYGKFFFIHGEIGKITIRNVGLHRI